MLLTAGDISDYVILNCKGIFSYIVKIFSCDKCFITIHGFADSLWVFCDFLDILKLSVNVKFKFKF